MNPAGEPDVQEPRVRPWRWWPVLLACIVLPACASREPRCEALQPINPARATVAPARTDADHGE